jgi:hypothetical protein
MADPVDLGQLLVDDNFMTKNLHLLDVYMGYCRSPQQQYPRA